MAPERIVGVIGLGMMGGGMARCFLRAGHRVIGVAHANRQPLERLAGEGLREVADIPALVAEAGIVLTCLPDAEAVERVVGQMAPELAPGKVWIDTTTSHPATTARVADTAARSGTIFADAPVTGGPPQAEAGELASLVGCREADFVTIEPIVAVYSKLVRRFGDPGAGHTAKLLNNLVSQGTMLLLAEAFGLARRKGVDAGALYDVMMAGAARSGTLEKAVGAMLGGDLDGSRFTLRNSEKDLRYVARLAAEAGAPGSLAEAIHARLRDVVGRGHGDRFVSRLLDPGIDPDG